MHKREVSPLLHIADWSEFHLMIRTITLSLFLLAAVGCSDLTKSLRPDGVSEKNLTPENGILIGSFSRSTKIRQLEFEEFTFKNVATGEGGRLFSYHRFNPMLGGGRTPDDFTTNESRGGLFVFSLPAGMYVFNNFRVFIHGFGSDLWKSRVDFSIPFEIHANKVNYVGEIKLDPSAGRVFFGMAPPGDFYWIVSDQSSRDIELLRRLRPDLPSNDIAFIVPDKKNEFTPLVVLPNEMKAYFDANRK